MASHYVFANKTLCYTVGPTTLRVLFLQTTARELKINTRRLITEAGGQPELTYKFRPLYFSHGILSCVYSQRRDDIKTHHLVILLFNPLRVLPVRLLESSRGLFVRNDATFLYYGVRTGRGESRDFHYVLSGLDLTTKVWSPVRLDLWKFQKSVLGVEATFDIFDGHFYGITTEAPLEDDYNSFYTAFRFVLGERNVQDLPEHLAWRRHWHEGTIDDRWSQLELVKDENSGRLFVYETRMESRSETLPRRRVCYRRELRFPESSEISPPPGWHSADYREERPREDVDVGDSDPDGPTHGDSIVRSYNVSVMAFVDIVYESYRSTKVLKIRTRSDASGASAEQQSTETAGVSLWPPTSPSDASNDFLLAVQRVLNPRKIECDARLTLIQRDERTTVYMPRSSKSRKLYPLVLTSFDPGLHLPGLRRLSRSRDGGCSWRAEDRPLPSRPSGIRRHFSPMNILEPSIDSADWVLCQREDCPPPGIEDLSEHLPGWAERSVAFYLSLWSDNSEHCGFHLAR